MKKLKKKLVAFLLALILPLTFVPKAAYATGEVIDGSITVLGVIGNFLDAFYPLIAGAIENSCINNGDYLEWVSFIPPSFAQDKFYISMFDGLNPQSSTLTYRIKIYNQLNPNNPVEVSLKSGQQYCVTADNNTPELYFEFFNGNETTPFERYCLPMEYHNKNFGIGLGSNKKVYYLQKETNRVFNDYLMRKIFNTPFNHEQIYNNLSPQSKALYDPYIFRKTKNSSKASMSLSNCVDNQSVLNRLVYYQNYRPLPFFTEHFENNALAAWNCIGNVGETLANSYGYGYSLYLSGDVAYIYKNFNDFLFNEASVYFYDDASVTSAKVQATAFNRSFDPTNLFGSISMGVDTDASTNYYVFSFSNSGAWITFTPRTTGWHKLTFKCVLPDRTELFIDNNFVGSACVYMDSIKSVSLGDRWADNKNSMNKFFFDYFDIRYN